MERARNIPFGTAPLSPPVPPDQPFSSSRYLFQAAPHVVVHSGHAARVVRDHGCAVGRRRQYVPAMPMAVQEHDQVRGVGREGAVIRRRRFESQPLTRHSVLVLVTASGDREGDSQKEDERRIDRLRSDKR